MASDNKLMKLFLQVKHFKEENFYNKSALKCYEAYFILISKSKHIYELKPDTYNNNSTGKTAEARYQSMVDYYFKVCPQLNESSA